MKPYTIQQISKLTGLTAHTLRYYEKIGLLNGVARDANGYRQYSEADIAWIHFLMRLRKTGMLIQEMLRFSDLRSQGEATINARRELLEAHQRGVQRQLSELKENLDKIQEKIGYYKKLEESPSSNHRRDFTN